MLSLAVWAPFPGVVPEVGNAAAGQQFQKAQGSLHVNILLAESSDGISAFSCHHFLPVYPSAPLKLYDVIIIILCMLFCKEHTPLIAQPGFSAVLHSHAGQNIGTAKRGKKHCAFM